MCLEARLLCGGITVEWIDVGIVGMGWDGIESKCYSIGDFLDVIYCAALGMIRHRSFVLYSLWVSLSDTI